MEFEKQNGISTLNNHISNQEIYAQEDNSFENDQENLNNSTSSDRFQTPSAKFIYDQISTKKQPSSNIRQSSFHNLDPLNESNSQNKPHSQAINQQLNPQLNTTLNSGFNNSLDNTMCIERTMMSNHNTFLPNRSISNENDTTFLNNTTFLNDCAMDLSNHQNSDQIKQQNLNENYEVLLNEKDLANEKLKKYVDQLNQLNQNLSEAVLAIQDKFEASLNEKNAVIQDLTLQNNVIAKEKKLAIEDVQGLETSFSELHRRYEKLKLALESCKKKEELFQDECLAFSEKLEECQKLNNDYKQRLEIVENEKNNIVETLKRQSEKEIISLRAQLKKAEMRCTGLQNQLEQKTQENMELNKMVDELTK